MKFKIDREKEKDKGRKRELYIREAKYQEHRKPFNTEIGITADDNCFRENSLDSRKDLFMQGSVLSIYFLYLLSDTVLQFSANSDVLYMYDNGFHQIGPFEVNRKLLTKVTKKKQTVHIQFQRYAIRELFPSEGSHFAI